MKRIWKYKNCPNCNGELEIKPFPYQEGFTCQICKICKKVFHKYHEDIDIESLPVGILVNDVVHFPKTKNQEKQK